ncbi:hypothetical protein [Salinibacterium sp. SWN1162]|uniref:hypothetical protein n=1 Tax=Salinibacterium sp. SWN1162 TaxID=2792053 RepID=UPI0018CD72A2|nr:hypothetical protein [Salinibacterium sp. SWN1162]MBH0008586.1 hypothetical protein [Salinibacterium sp. SWN1162]
MSATMADDLHIDTAAVSDIAVRLSHVADAVPDNLSIDASDSCSAAIVAAIEDVNMWARVAAHGFEGRIRAAGVSASMAAAAFEQADADLASAAKG